VLSASFLPFCTPSPLARREMLSLPFQRVTAVILKPPVAGVAREDMLIAHWENSRPGIRWNSAGRPRAVFLTQWSSAMVRQRSLMRSLCSSAKLRSVISWDARVFSSPTPFG